MNLKFCIKIRQLSALSELFHSYATFDSLHSCWQAVNQKSLSDTEKREKMIVLRKLEEMEQELKVWHTNSIFYFLFGLLRFFGKIELQFNKATSFRLSFAKLKYNLFWFGLV